MDSRVSRKLSPSSQKMVAVGMENYRSGKQLEAQLERLERERRGKLRELNQESKHFADAQFRLGSARSRDNSPGRICALPSISPGRENSMHSDHSLSPSLSPRSPSASPPKSRSPSPRPLYLAKSFSTEEGTKQRSPSSSPEAQKRLLSKRPPSPRVIGRSMSITETSTVVPLSLTNKQLTYSPVSAIKKAEHLLRNNAGFLDSTNSLIPQIIINDTAINNQAGKEKSTENPTSNRKKSTERPSDVTDGSLAVPLRTYRRNSVPAVATPPSYLRTMAKKESTFVTEDADLDINRSSIRGRSSSICVPYFSHLKDAPRRDSLLRKYIAKRGHYRRTAVTLERLISDLAKGVHHKELLDGYWKTADISSEEWEKLKECRYLRMPSQDEDVVGNTIDIKEIFSKKQVQ